MCGLTLQKLSLNHHLLYSHGTTARHSEHMDITNYLDANNIPLPVPSCTWIVNKDTLICPVHNCSYVVPQTRTIHTSLCTNFANHHHLYHLEATDYDIVQCDLCKSYLIDEITYMHLNSAICKEITERVIYRKI